MHGTPAPQPGGSETGHTVTFEDEKGNPIATITVPEGEGVLPPDVTAPEGYRLAGWTVNGQPFDAEATYAVITSNANFNGMDSSYIFAAAAEANEKSTITTAVVRDVVWLYIAGELDNQIGEAYAEAQGRITVK